HAPLLTGTAEVIIASTRAADGTYEDRTGPLLVTWLEGRGLEPVHRRVVGDGPAVGQALAAAIAAGADIVITSGGTGISPTDATPEQTAPLLEREMPGILEEVRRRGAAKIPTALLSRGLGHGRPQLRGQPARFPRRGERRHRGARPATRPPAGPARRRGPRQRGPPMNRTDRKSTRLNSSHVSISYAVFCLKKKNKTE